jgi:hypothetical protein
MRRNGPVLRLQESRAHLQHVVHHRGTPSSKQHLRQAGGGGSGILKPSPCRPLVPRGTTAPRPFRGHRQPCQEPRAPCAFRSPDTLAPSSSLAQADAFCPYPGPVDYPRGGSGKPLWLSRCGVWGLGLERLTIVGTSSLSGMGQLRLSRLYGPAEMKDLAA